MPTSTWVKVDWVALLSAVPLMNTQSLLPKLSKTFVSSDNPASCHHHGYFKAIYIRFEYIVNKFQKNILNTMLHIYSLFLITAAAIMVASTPSKPVGIQFPHSQAPKQDVHPVIFTLLSMPDPTMLELLPPVLPPPQLWASSKSSKVTSSTYVSELFVWNMILISMVWYLNKMYVYFFSTWEVLHLQL